MWNNWFSQCYISQPSSIQSTFLPQHSFYDMKSQPWSIASLKSIGNVRFYIFFQNLLFHKPFLLNLDANTDVQQYLMHANDLNELMWTILLKYIMPIAIVFNMILAAVSAIISNWLHGELVSSDLYHPFNKMWVTTHYYALFGLSLIYSLTTYVHSNSQLPWNQLTFIGYLAEAFYTFMVGEMYLLASSYIVLFVSMCQHLDAFNQMFRHFVNELNQNPTKRNDKRLLCQLIHFHIEVKE